MIRPNDVEFHPIPPEYKADWTESNYFPFVIPEAGLAGCVYNLFRPGLGVAMSDVTIFDRIARTWEGLAYVDNQQHLPCPERLSRYSLPNGVSVEVLEAPRDYRVDYCGIDATEVHMEFRGIMRPQDFNDAEQDPITRRQKEGEASGWDKAFNGHFDMTGRVTGELVLRGRRHVINCLSTMDRSWGPRKQRDTSNVAVAQAHFGEDFAINVLAGLDPCQAAAFRAVHHGYVVAGGEVCGLIAGKADIRRVGMFAAAMRLELEDEHGRTYRLTGSPVNWAPWAPYPSTVYYQSLMQWWMGDQVGYGPYQEVISRAFITRHRLAD